jgi:hypothetical protein
VPRLDDLHPAEDAVGEAGARSEVREEFQRVGYEARLVEARLAVSTFIDMRAQRGDAESGFAIEQQVDFVG